MKEDLIFKKKFLSLLSVIAVGLFILSSRLYADNRFYKQKNRELILQNDSLVSVNIKLKTLNRDAERPAYGKHNTPPDKKWHDW
jgi:hypothetical protein